jgi:xylose isomerase
MAEYFPEIKETYRLRRSRFQKSTCFQILQSERKDIGHDDGTALRFAVCYWHTFRSTGVDMFGSQTLFRNFRQGGDEIILAEQH